MDTKSDRDLLESVIIDVAVIKNKMDLLDKVHEAVNLIRKDCRSTHDALHQSEKDIWEKCAGRFADLEKSQGITAALADAREVWSGTNKALFWSGMIAAATMGQVITAIVLHFMRAN